MADVSRINGYDIKDTTARNGLSSKANVPTYTTSTMTSSGWSNGIYSFTSTYPTASYDIEVSLSDTATSSQRDAYAEAMIVGSATDNIVTALGTIPTVDIPIVIKVVAK